jgi:hypothetical protein
LNKKKRLLSSLVGVTTVGLEVWFAVAMVTNTTKATTTTKVTTTTTVLQAPSLF